MDDNKGKPSEVVDTAKYFDGNMKIAYVEQIYTGKMTTTDAVNELSWSKSAIYSWIKKLCEDREHGLPGKAKAYLSVHWTSYSR